MDNSLREKWKKLWNQSKGSVYQSWEMVEALEKTGKKPILVKVGKGNEIDGGIFVFEYSVEAGGIKKNILSAYGFPVGNKGEQIEVLRELRSKAANHLYATVAPNSTNTFEEVFNEARYKKASNYTLVVNLDKSMEELFDNLEKKSARWGVKTAEKNGLKISFAKTADEIDEFYALYKRTFETGGFRGEPKVFIEHLNDTDISKLFIVKLKDKIVAGGLLLIDKNNRMSILDLTGSSDEGLKLQAMPFLYWKMIEYSKKEGLKHMDLGGYDKEAIEGDKTDRINKFKERFGGEIIEQPIFSSNGIYPLFRSMLRNMKFMKKVYRKN